MVTTQEGESLHGFFVFGWIKLKFGVSGNFGLLISNLNSKTQYQFKILTLFHMGGGGGVDSALLQIVFFITSVRDAAEPQNLVTFPKI